MELQMGLSSPDLLWYPLTTDSKNSTLPGCKEIHGAWLLWITGVMYLLGHAKWEMNSDVVLQWLHTRVWRRWQELIVLCEPLMDHLTGLLAHGTVVRPFFGGKLDVCASAALMVSDFCTSGTLAALMMALLFC